MSITLITNKEPPNHECTALCSALGPLVAMAAAIWPTCAQPAEWRIAPSVGLRETYTDNVRLAPRGSEKSDFVSKLTPAIEASGSGPRLKARAKLGLQFISYAHDSEGSKTAHLLDAAANAELVEGLFFVDGSAAINQQNISPFGPQPVDNTNATGNRTTVRTYTLSPYLRHRFGSSASSEARYTRSSTATSTAGLQDADMDQVLVSLNSGPAFRTLGWGLQYSHQKTRFENAQTTDFETSTGSLRYMVSQRFHLTATGGYDQYDYVAIGEKPSGRFYTGGFSWRPTERTSIAASAGKRFWGRTYMLESSVRSRRSLWRVSYNEGITTSQAQFALQATNSTSDFLNQLLLPSIPDPVARQQVVDRFILNAGLPPTLSRSINYFSNQFFLQKSLQASVALTGAKNTLLFSLFNTRREAQTAVSATDALFGASGSALDANTRQTGLGAAWQWRVTALTDASVNAGYARTRHETTDERQILRTLRAAVATQIQPKLNGGLELRRQMQTSDFAGNSYIEHGIAAFVSMRF